MVGPLPLGGLDEAATEEIVHAAFIPFGDIVEVNIPRDFKESESWTQRHQGAQDWQGERARVVAGWGLRAQRACLLMASFGIGRSP